jgi:triacylglycerol lipase
MISRLRMADRVSAVVMISTPHRGSPYADWCLLNLGKRIGGLKLMHLLNLDVNALHDLTTASCLRFNEEVPDSPNVRYFSVSASRPWHLVPPFFYHSHKIIADAQGANDGLVSVDSAIWGQHLGTWRADHLHVINKRMVLEIKGQRTGDVTPRYLKILDQLHDLGCCA